MSERDNAPNGAETVEESTSDSDIANPADQDDTSIRAYLSAALGADSDEQPAEAPEDDEDADPTDDGAEQPTVADDEDAPPQSWTADEREIWSELPESARDAIRRTDKAAQARMRTDAEVWKRLEPLQQQLEGSGVHVDQYLDGLLQADQYIQQRPLDAVLQIVQSHGLADQLRDALMGDDTPPSEPRRSAPTDDRGARAEAEVRQLRAELQAREQWQAFVAEHSDAEQLRKLIAAEITIDPRIDYATAYQRARETVSGLTAQDAQTAERNRISDATRAAGKGNALHLPRGRSAQPPPNESTGNLREDIAIQLRKAGLR